MTEQPPHVFRNKLGDYSWLPEDRDAVCDGACEILERMQGYTDEEISVEIEKYLGQLYAQSKGRVN